MGIDLYNGTSVNGHQDDGITGDATLAQVHGKGYVE